MWYQSGHCVFEVRYGHLWQDKSVDPFERQEHRYWYLLGARPRKAATRVETRGLACESHQRPQLSRGVILQKNTIALGMEYRRAGEARRQGLL
jgi:hypothetical protein